MSSLPARPAWPRITVNHTNLAAGAILAAGFGVILTNDFLNLVFGYDWARGLYHLTPIWIRLLTYCVLGYVVAVRKDIGLGVLATMLASLADGIVGWATCLPTLLSVFGWAQESAEWQDTLQSLMSCMAVGGFCGAAGAGFAWLRKVRGIRRDASAP